MYNIFLMKLMMTTTLVIVFMNDDGGDLSEKGNDNDNNASCRMMTEVRQSAKWVTMITSLRKKKYVQFK